MDFFKDEKKRLISIALIAVAAIGLLFYELDYKRPASLIDMHREGERVIVELSDKGSCAFGKEYSTDLNWVSADENHACTLDIEDYQTNLYVVNRYNQLSFTKENLDFSHVESITITSGDVYLAVGGKEQLTYETTHKGVVDGKVILKSENEDIATIDENNVIHAVALGTTNIIASYEDLNDSIKVTVTDLIVLAPREFDMQKPFLPCGAYSKEENDLIDEILASRVDKAGRHTRAGVVEAARFLALEFPYRINYFTENGRVDSYVNKYCDGEGRYYHLGLYLDPSRYEGINKNMTVAGPACWGCLLNEYSYDRVRANGLDCSGFVSWAIYNGGFDCRDLGAGIASDWPDLTDLGKKLVLSEELKADRLRVGDLLSGPFGGTVYEGGHIAIVAGIDPDGYIYIAEELGYRDYWGYFIKKYDKQSLLRYFFYRVDMEEYYAGEDGNLTDFWINE